jgi:hypothetical protein
MMKFLKSVRGWPPNWNRVLVAIGMCSSIVVVMAGSAALSSCATPPAGMQREESAILSLSNTVESMRKMAPVVPAPASGFVEPILAVVSAGLAAWSAHLHRRVNALTPASGAVAYAPAPAPAPPALAPAPPAPRPAAPPT